MSVIDHNYSRLNAELKKLRKSYVKVGFPVGGEVKPPLQSATDEDNELADDISEIASIAFWNEFGTTRTGWSEKGIPSRSFMRTSFQENIGKYKKLLKELWLKITKGTMTVKQAYSIIGEIAVADLKEKIIELDSPSNENVTIKLKKSMNPLIDKGQMVQSAQYITVIKR